jgi:exopolyphosphatase/pppGpp-phosphohydrolase
MSTQNALKPAPTKKGRPSGETRTSVRVGVIEVGSRATRLLVADVTREGRLEPVASPYEHTHLMEATREGLGPLRSEVGRICELANRFRAQAEALGAMPIVAFGTAAVRQIASTEEFRDLLREAQINVLDRSREAMFSLMTGIEALPSVNGSSVVLVIDQGAGSTEMAAGRIGPPIEVIGGAGLKFGGNALLQSLHDCRLNVRAFRERVIPAVEACKLPVQQCEHVVIQGTVATKCAWLDIRKDHREKRYDPRLVHGHKLRAQVLRQSVAEVEKWSSAQWHASRAFVNPEDPEGDGFDRVVAGLVPLLHLLKRVNKEEFVVSALGTRHGLALAVARPLMTS